MPIKGIIQAMPMKDSLREMPNGSTGYIIPFEAVVTRNALFISWEATIFSPEDIKGTKLSHIKVSGIGELETPEDFEFDFTDCARKKDTFALESENVYDDLKDDRDFLHIPITEKDLEVIEEDKRSEIEKLEIEHQEAVRDEKYESAEKLLKRIKSLKKEKN